MVKYREKSDSVRWHNKVVYVLSTSHRTAMKKTNRADTDGNAIQKPTSIIDYNHNISGIDLVDQQLDSLDALRKSYSWYKKLFLRLVLQCTLAAHKLYKKQGGRMTSFSFFKMYAPYFLRMHHDWKAIHPE